MTSAPGRPRDGRPGPAARRLVGGLLVGLTLAGAGCAAQATSLRPSQPLATPSRAVTGPGATEPGRVAASYLDAVMRADFRGAAGFVAPDQRDVVASLGLASGPGTLLAMTGDVSVGRVLVQGDRATAVFVGRMCRTAQAGGGATSAPECIQNSAADAEAPAFTVHLRRGAAGWQVSLPTPDAP